jgi:acetyl-CoA carboxylase biotin carboxylase subunit
MIRVATGASLPEQASISHRGHAIECRILAEDPARNFLPSPGTIRHQRVPGGPGIRYDGGTEAGSTVPDAYDALIGKLLAWGLDRAEAIARMRRALGELRVDGLPTSIVFHRRVMDHPAFQRGELHTGFIEEHPELLAAADAPELVPLAVRAAAVAHLARLSAGTAAAPPARHRSSAWKWHRRP